MMFLPVWFYFDFPVISSKQSWTNENSNTNVVFLLAVDAICHWLQNIVAFTIMNRLSRLSYAVANATKRIVIITTSLLLLQNHVTTTNVCGMAMAIGGVFAYNKVKLDEKKAKESLPTTVPFSRPASSIWDADALAAATSPKVRLLGPQQTTMSSRPNGATSAYANANGNGVYRPFQA